MTLITAGYLPNTYIPENYLMLDYIPEYALTLGGDSARYYYYDKLPKKNNKQLYQTIKTLLEAIKGE